MRNARLRNTIVRVFTAAVLVTSQTALAQTGAERTAEGPAVPSVDVILASGGVLHGYVVNASGAPVGNVEVKLTSPAGEVVAAKSDEKGRFGFRGLQGSGYQLETEHGVVMCRAWTAKAAPPKSSATLLVVHDAELVRGQWSAPPGVNNGVSRLKRAMTNPFFVATVVGAAVAIPVAIHNANQDDSSS
ncbi:carboxypeptidase-like regulatory domain-containing protein [Aeoliella sp.]|uniref:carboxypeptidase-like regulatory domain-containing protein n=1 Tax=Aeoliella sp. TaxID=2795800 RepID=UPI003CCC1AA4